MSEYNKVTKDMKDIIKSMKAAGLTNKKVGENLGIAPSTVAYHSDEDQRQKSIKRSIKNQKPLSKEQREKKKIYMREYMSNRYKNDSEFRERIRETSRENWRKKGGKE